MVRAAVRQGDVDMGANDLIRTEVLGGMGVITLNRPQALNALSLAVDKDGGPRWNPGRLDDVTPDMDEVFFTPVWPDEVHPLRDLLDVRA